MAKDRRSFRRPSQMLSALFRDPLIRQTLGKQTRTKYTDALRDFEEYVLERPASDRALDLILASYVRYQFSKNPRTGNKQRMQCLLCALQVIYPIPKHALVITKRCLRGWTATVPHRSAAPLTKKFMMAFVAYLAATNRKEAAIATALA